jgi:hypothetical protein
MTGDVVYEWLMCTVPNRAVVSRLSLQTGHGSRFMTPDPINVNQGVSSGTGRHFE